MSRDVSTRGAPDVVDWQSWWGDVEFVNEESGEVHCHFGPVAYVDFADDTGHRFQALTVGELNSQLAHLGIRIEHPSARLNEVACICDCCRHLVDG